MKEYKIVIYQESAFGSFLLWQSKIDPLKLTDFLNEHAKEGYRVVTMERENRRMLLFFSREAMVITLEREAS